MKPIKSNSYLIFKATYQLMQFKLKGGVWVMENQNEYYDRIEYISESGKALDNFGNEFHDEGGAVIYIPLDLRYLFKTIQH